MIVMGAFLLLTAWRMTRGTRGWTPRLILTGAGLLALGYSVLTPLYQAGIVVPLGRIGTIGTNPDVVILCHGLRLLAMNGGWLLLGLGLATHAGLFETARSTAPVQAPRRTTSPRTSPVHEPVS
jgi:hypothetical protein